MFFVSEATVAEFLSSPRSGGVKPGARRKARHYALQALYQWQLARAPLGEIEAQFRADYDFRSVDLEFFQNLLHQVPAELTELEASFASYLDRTVADLDPVERNLLRMGSWELVRRIDVPYRVVINEYVSLAKKFGATDSHKYVNGILDQVARQVRRVEIDAERRGGG